VDLVRDGVALAYDDTGSDYPPLVFLHGAVCNRRVWDQQLPRLSPAHRVIAVDLRPFQEPRSYGRYLQPGSAVMRKVIPPIDIAHGNVEEIRSVALDGPCP